jgi:hypothetical protein
MQEHPGSGYIPSYYIKPELNEEIALPNNDNHRLDDIDRCLEQMNKFYDNLQSTEDSEKCNWMTESLEIEAEIAKQHGQLMELKKQIIISSLPDDQRKALKGPDIVYVDRPKVEKVKEPYFIKYTPTSWYLMAVFLFFLSMFVCSALAHNAIDYNSMNHTLTFDLGKVYREYMELLHIKQ